MQIPGVLEMKMVEHYYTEKQRSPFKPVKIRFRVAGIEFDLYTAGGVFSPKKLDNGSRLLIESAILKDGWNVLDFGCGYGVVGIALKKIRPGVDVVMSDVNSRAVKLSRMNAKLNRLDIPVFQGDIFSNKQLLGMMFDAILLNPPQTAGKDVCFRMIDEAKVHLVAGGLLQIVARSQKGGKQLSKKMEETFGNVRDVAKGSGFRVYASENK
ncbi:class I SAM-dependent methyltransferase [Nanoarchaeota archaeon]